MRRAVSLTLTAVLVGAAVPAVTFAAPPEGAVQPATAPEPLPETAQIDPDALKAARVVVEKLFPVGTYRKIMGKSMSTMMDSMMDGVMKMPIAQLARIGGVPEEELLDMKESSLEEMTAIVDPYFRERTKRGMDAMMGGMTDLMDGFEPRVRDALSRAYARNFSVGQLAEMDRFFSTPTGSAYAEQSMTIFMDPEIMGEMQALMPEMMKKMPELAKKSQQAVKDLPPPRKIGDLSKPERKRLAELLGVKEEDLKDRAYGAPYEEGTEQ